MIMSARDLVLPPNVLSLARIPLAAGFAVGVATGQVGLATAILALACATDVADGWFARHFRQETATGRVVDPLSDKLFFLTAAVALVASGRLGVLAVLLLATREIAQLVLAATLAVRRRLLRTGTAVHARALGKLTTTLQAATAAAALLWPVARPPLVAGTALFGAAAAVDYWRSSLSAPRSSPGG
jgi:CDP-diacylglycerol--glycerol-3-phosphate 3-phosphatidyltransferase/cardiolipin synthase